MAASDTVVIERLTAADVDAGMALSTEAGWNQTADDWLHFIVEGQAFGVRDAAGRLVASAAALPYDGPLGFVSMVLVMPQWRRRGLATSLVDRCVEELRVRDLVPVLDATAAGVEVYRKQGFLGQFGFDRWQGMADGRHGEQAHALTAADIVPLDAAVSGASRDRLIGDFLARPGTAVIGDESGFAMLRAGRRAAQAGPVIASGEDAAIDLIQQLFALAKGLLFIDVPSVWRRIGNWLTARGFEIQRSFTRMALGRAEPFSQPNRLFAVAGPEFG